MALQVEFKTASPLTVEFNGLAGAAGADGQDGIMIRYGTGAPSDTLGNDGDSYIDTSADTIRYDKGSVTPGSWTGITAVSLVGPQGPAGATGPQGPAGPAGADGADGADGATGPQGPAGADGISILYGTGTPSDTLGNDGDSYIDTSADTIRYDKGSVTPGSWTGITAVSLVGPQGPAGATGPQGPAGPAGADGADGADGATGPQGPAGPAGANGSDGADGATVLNGSIDPTTEGVDGDFYINTSNNTIFGPKTGGSWGSGTSLVGPTPPKLSCQHIAAGPDVAAAEEADGKELILIPHGITGDITHIGAKVGTDGIGTTGTIDIEIERERNGTTVAILSTILTIDANEAHSGTASTPAVINTSNDDVEEWDLLKLNLTGTPTGGTAPQGLTVYVVIS